MITRRIVPSLLLSGRKLVKTHKFGHPKYVGDPINAVKIFNDKEVDEIIILDIEASQKKTEPQFDFLKEVVSESFVPLSYGGGIKSLDQIDRLLQMGIEKVCLNTVNINDFNLLSQASKKHGAQSIVGVIDVKKNFFGRKKVYFKSQNLMRDESIEDYAYQMQQAGAGEIFLNFVDRDGTYEGYDLDLTEKVTAKLQIPLIVLGGAGSIEDFSKAFKAGANAVAAGSLFVFHGPHKAVLINYPDRKEIDKIILEN